MDFLRRLHAARTEAPGQARADLGSRFAPRLGAGGSEASGDSAGVEAPAAERRERVEAASQSVRGDAGGRPAEVDAPDIGAARRERLAQDKPHIVAASTVAPAIAMPRTAAANVAEPHPVFVAAQRPPPAADGSAPMARTDPTHVLDPWPAAPAQASSAVAGAPRAGFAAHATSRPLRDSALAGAAGGAIAAPAVVQVTIDRIDVRVPPPAPAAAPARPRRSAPGAPTLADYLRGPGRPAR